MDSINGLYLGTWNKQFGWKLLPFLCLESFVKWSSVFLTSYSMNDPRIPTFDIFYVTVEKIPEDPNSKNEKKKITIKNDSESSEN